MYQKPKRKLNKLYQIIGILLLCFSVIALSYNITTAWFMDESITSKGEPDIIVIGTIDIDVTTNFNFYNIALARIYADAAGIHWLEVKQIIVNIFAGTDFDIRIVYLNEYLDGNIIDPDMEKLNYGKDRQAIDGNTRYKYY